MVMSNHLVLMFERFAFYKHKVAKRHVYRYDRQDFLGPAAWSGILARDCLKAMQVTHTNDNTGEIHEPERTAGTIECVPPLSAPLLHIWVPPMAPGGQVIPLIHLLALGTLS